MRKLLQGSANLEFWEPYNSEEIEPYLRQLDSRYAALDTTAEANQHPLLSILQTTSRALSTVGYAAARDTAEVNSIIYSDIAKQVLPSDLKLLWGAKESDYVRVKGIYDLHAL